MRWQQKWKADMHEKNGGKKREETEAERERERERKKSTYNRKQRNLVCSDSDFLGLIREGRGAAEVEKRSSGLSRGGAGGCATHGRG